MTDNQRIKREILKEWKAQFPFLKTYGTISMMLRTDLNLLGLQLPSDIHGYPDYEVYFIIKPLWHSRLTQYYCNVGEAGKSGGRHHVGIEFKFHNRYFDKTLERVNEYFGAALNGEVTYKFLYEEVILENIYLSFDHILFSMSFVEHLMALALYFQDDILWQKVYAKYQKCCKIWRKRIRSGKYWVGGYTLEDIDEWEQYVSRVFASKNTLLAECEKNADTEKILRLNKGELINIGPVIDTSFKNDLNNLYKRIFHPKYLRW